MEKLERLRDARRWQLVEARSRNVLRKLIEVSPAGGMRG